MSPSPKIFYARQRWFSPTQRRIISIFSFVIGVAGIVFGMMAVFRTSVGYECVDFEPVSVSIAWKGGDDGRSRDASVLEGGSKRHKAMGFVGIQTGFGSSGRRRSLRKTWMPSDRQGLRRLEEATGLAFRFVIGRTSDQIKMSELRKEVMQYDDFMLLDIEEEYSNLPHKTLAFFKAAYGLFDSDFYVKADDDIYLRPDRLSLLLAKERSNPLTYLGCMKMGPVITDPNLKWYESHFHLLGSEYFLHAYGPIYALSGDVVASLVALKNNSFRMFNNEDVTIGAWMLALNVNHEHDGALCSPVCTQTSIAVWDIPKCSGLCNPEEKLLALHHEESCSSNTNSGF